MFQTYQGHGGTAYDTKALERFRPIQINLHIKNTFFSFSCFFALQMDCGKLIESLDILGYAGICVGVENSQVLQNSLLILQQENHFKKCYYWGKINGIHNDYHVAYGFERDCMNGKKFYYSIDGMNWLLLPDSTKCARFLTPLAINQFEGDPSIVTNVYEANPPFAPNEDNDQLYKEEALAKGLKEEDRLASTVQLINEDAAVIPRGGWFKCLNGDVIENSAFEGLNRANAAQLKFYLHARPPQKKWITNLLLMEDYNYATDFLDSLDWDVPRKCWNLQLLQGAGLAGQLVILQNLYWPGMTFYHKINTPHYGFLYFGSGKKNMDLLFMV
ncbi:radial spoke head protein 9 homolog [Prorops nasuta]|uniref:radial spoke head protein 9 homolog n=1 Tax=Prorops nasuta TaxID=863751 RepID=UPI0034CE0159